MPVRQAILSLLALTCCGRGAWAQSGIDLGVTSASLPSRRAHSQPGQPIVQFEIWLQELDSSNYSESVYADVSARQDTSGHTVLQRIVRDNLRHIYVSYSVEIEESPGGESWTVGLSPSSSAAPSLPAHEQWTVASPLMLPVPQVVEAGDEIPVELYSAGNGARAVDYIRIGDKTQLARRTGGARDSYAEDAEFSLKKPRLRVNGIAVAAVPLPGVLAGRILWIYAPGLGRFVFTYANHPEAGFQLAGEVSATELTAIFDRTLLRLDSQGRIAPGGGIYNVYAARDAKWLPADPADRGKFMAGTSPGIETVLPAL